MLFQRSVARYQNSRNSLFLLEKHFRSALLFEAGNPRFNRPHRVETSLFEKRQLFGVRRRQHLRFARCELNFDPVFDKPRAAGYVLRVAELRRADFLSPEVGGFFDSRLGVYDKSRSAVGRAGKNSDVAPARFRERVDCGVRSDVRYVYRAREHRFHRARARVEQTPFDFDVIAEAFLKPSFALSAELVRDQCLRVRDVRKVSDLQHGLSRRRERTRLKGERNRKKHSKCLRHFHAF